MGVMNSMFQVALHLPSNSLIAEKTAHALKPSQNPEPKTPRQPRMRGVVIERGDVSTGEGRDYGMGRDYMGEVVIICHLRG